MAIVGSHYFYYVIFAFAALLVRIFMRKMRLLECALLAMWFVCMIIEFVQLMFGGGVSFFGTKTWGLPRYFGVFAPFIWILGSWGLSCIWDWGVRIQNRKFALGKCLVAAMLLWMLFCQLFPELRGMYKEGNIPDVQIASRAAARIIRNDYRGPRKQEQPKRRLLEYYTANRPVVFSAFSYVAWLLRGQSEGAQASSGVCPYKDDYLFIRVGSGYGNIETVDSKQYDFVARIPGRGTEWRLFRRKTTPHRE